MDLRFSVVVPVYNVQDYLDACIKSILDQGRSDFEVVLVDDGSTDDSGRICDCYAAAHDFIHVIHKPNEGPLLARQSGFREARGQYVVPVDSDDLLLPGALDTIDIAIRQTGADVVCYQWTRSRPEPGPTVTTNHDTAAQDNAAKQFVVADKSTAVQWLCSRNVQQNMCAKAIRWECLGAEKDYSAFKGLSYGEDFLQTLEVYDLAESFCYLDDVLYYYRPNSASITNTYNSRRYEDILTALDHADRYAQKWETQLGCTGLVTSMATHRLDSTLNYAFYLVEHGHRASLERLAGSQMLETYCAIPHAVEGLRPDRRLGLFLLRHRHFGLLRLHALARQKSTALRTR